MQREMRKEITRGKKKLLVMHYPPSYRPIKSLHFLGSVSLLCRMDFRSCIHQMPHVYVTDSIADNFDT